MRLPCVSGTLGLDPDLLEQLSEDISTPKCPDTLGKVVITFENGKFSRCDFPFRGTYNREQWAILAEIESEIHRIELNLLR